MARRHHLTGRALAGALLAGLLTACAPSSAEEPVPVMPSSPPGPTAEGSPTSLPNVPVRDATAPAQASKAAPVRLVVRSLDIDMDVVPVGVADDGTMAIPPDAHDAGWYRFGPAPGSAGHTVLAAHVDSRLSGIGPFARLRDVEKGVTVVVTDSARDDHRYRVTSVRRIPKDDAPVASWFAREGRERLVLVTCGGAWRADIGHYADNVVVTADPIGG
jgi:LPXTG-site transpeptidase (sortase) family protein